MNNNIISEKFIELAQLFQQYTSQPEQGQKMLPKEKEIEALVPEYLNPIFKDKIKLPPMFRFNQSGLRYYFTAQNADVKFYPSVTTIIEKTTEMSPGLKKIMADLGFQGFYAMMKEKAHYGTLLHLLIADYLRNDKSFDTDTIPARVYEYVNSENIRFNTDNWSFNLNKDLRSLVQFINDYEVEPIAIEMVGFYDDGQNRFAGAIDLLCEMTIEEKGYFGEVYASGANKGQPKETKQSRRVTAIVDFKSGKSGFHDDYEIQLHMYRLMAEQSFGVKPDKVFNVAPKDWNSVPTYSAKDQTDSPEAARIPFLLGSFACIWSEPKEILIMSGKLNGGNMADCTKWVSASEWVLKKLGIIPNKPTNGTAKTAETKLSVKEQKRIEAEGLLKSMGVNGNFIEVTKPVDELHELAEKIKAQPVKFSVDEDRF